MDVKFVTQEDRQEFANFCHHHMKPYIGFPSVPLYHYTTGAALIEIIKSGTLWATQVACLNDETELLFAIEQIRKTVQATIKDGTYARSNLVFEKIDEALSKATTETAGYFIACLTEADDDLSQWRAYSDGEGGYALKFNAEKLAKNAFAANRTLLVRVEYIRERHDFVVADVIKWTDHYYQQGLSKGRAPTAAEWATELAYVWLEKLGTLAILMKHGKFSAEKEWRLLHFFSDEDKGQMRFLQRASTITRHLALPLGSKDDKPFLDPLSGVVVGPCRYKRASRIAVGDLLTNYGYDINTVVKISETEVPYRKV